MFSTFGRFSRSGSTISGGLLARVSHTAAAEYTFIFSSTNDGSSAAWI